MTEIYGCTECGSTNRSSLDVARCMGWRIWEGVSVTGKALKVRLCPRCVDSSGEAGTQASWGVGCETCDWEWEDEGGEGSLTEKQAREIALDHRCEPMTWVKTPEEMEKERARWNALLAKSRAVAS